MTRTVFFTLTFDSSPIKGEGLYGWFIFLPTTLYGFPLPRGMTVKDAGNEDRFYRGRRAVQNLTTAVSPESQRNSLKSLPIGVSNTRCPVICSP